MRSRRCSSTSRGKGTGLPRWKNVLLAVRKERERCPCASKQMSKVGCFWWFYGVLYFFCVLCGSVVVFVLADKGRGLSSPDLVKRCAALQPACSEAGRLYEFGAPRCAWQRAGHLAWVGRRAWRGGLCVHLRGMSFKPRVAVKQSLTSIAGGELARQELWGCLFNRPLRLAGRSYCVARNVLQAARRCERNH